MMRYLWLCLAVLFAGPALAGEAQVVDAKLRQEAGGSYTISATVRHDDAGWEHYADRWEVLDADGDVIAARVLLHPHVGEQPFTRSLPGVAIPDGIDEIYLRANDSVHGLGPRFGPVGVPRSR